MTNRPKAIGTWTETSIVRYLTPNGFGGAEGAPRADRIVLHGEGDEGDIGVCPGVMMQSKGGKTAEAASDALIEKWLDDTETQRVNRGADVAVLVLKRKGKGAANAGAWWAFLPGWAFVYLTPAQVPGYDYSPTPYRIVLGYLPAVRITLAEAVALLRRAGYGDPL